MIRDTFNGRNRFRIQARSALWSSNGEIQLGDRRGRFGQPPSGAGRPVDDSTQGYPFVSGPILVTDASQPLSFGGGTITIDLFAGGGYGTDSKNPNTGPDDYTQRVTINMQGTSIPQPRLSHGAPGDTPNDIPRPNSDVKPFEAWCFHREGAFKTGGGGSDGSPVRGKGGRLNDVWRNPSGAGALIHQSDSTISYVIEHGDDRLVAARRNIGSGGGKGADFVKHAGYGSAEIASNFSQGNRPTGFGRNPSRNLSLVPDSNAPGALRPHLPDTFRAEFNSWNDWDNTMASELDGPFINKPDEGNSRGIEIDDYNPAPEYGAVDRQSIPYFNQPWIQEAAGASFWSPNRIMPGPGMFGSLPTGVIAGQPWQTLLFRPLLNNGQGDSGSKVHPGFELPKDHMLLDFFWMPVVEPWSISEPVSTAGKINLNFAMEPFHHITRTSSLRGLFASEQMLTVPNNLGRSYKAGVGYGRGYNRWQNTGGDLRQTSLRSWIDADETLRQFEGWFGFNSEGEVNDGRHGGDNRIFRTASQICEIWMVPESVRGLRFSPPPSAENIGESGSVWDSTAATGFGVVGDNSRERVYTNLLPRLTTKSNTYQVHFRCQVVKQSPLSPLRQGQRRESSEYRFFDQSIDNVVSEYRGSTVIERYVDPSDRRIPDFATEPPSSAQPETLDDYYRYRIVSTKRFAP